MAGAPVVGVNERCGVRLFEHLRLLGSRVHGWFTAITEGPKLLLVSAAVSGSSCTWKCGVDRRTAVKAEVLEHFGAVMSEWAAIIGL